jgi:protein arginine kinase
MIKRIKAEELLLKNPLAVPRMMKSMPVILCRRLELKRNLSEWRFADFMSRDEREESACEVVSQLLSQKGFFGRVSPSVFDLSVSGASAVDRKMFFERSLLPRACVNADFGGGAKLVLASDEKISALVNFKDHLHIGAFVGEKESFDDFYRKKFADKISRLSQNFSFAFDEEFGYLTADTSEAGCGLSASFTAHLCGFSFCKEIASLKKAMAELGVRIETLFCASDRIPAAGEGVPGDFYRFTVIPDAASGEDELLAKADTIVNMISEREKLLRAKLFDTFAQEFFDLCGRAYGTLRYCYRLGEREALSTLSLALLGSTYGVLPRFNLNEVYNLLVLMQPGHLQKLCGKSLKSAELSVNRAALCRKSIRVAAANHEQ